MKSILLLGPGYPAKQLDRRMAIKECLESRMKGVRIIVMEKDYPQSREPLYRTFGRLLETERPDLIVAFYTKSRHSDAVDFELGSLTCERYYPPPKIILLLERGLRREYVTKYVIRGFIPGIYRKRFSNKNDACEQIRNAFYHHAS